jgi:hypothetical protein
VVKKRWFWFTQYNMVRVLEAMSEMIVAKGGTITRENDPLLICCAGYNEVIRHLEEGIQRVQTAYDCCSDPVKNADLQEKRKNALAKMRARLEEVKKEEENAPVIRTRLVSMISDLGISFELGGFCYSYSTDSNPFFPDNITKYPVGEGGKYYSVGVEAGDKKWLYDDLFKSVANETTIKQAATVLLEFMEGMNQSVRYA